MLNSRIGKGTLAVSVFVFAWSLMSSTVLFAQLELASHDPRPAEVDSIFSSFNRPDGAGWAVGVIQDGKFLYKRCYGMADIEEKIPITSETLFLIASMSKQFTAACIALLAVRGEISLDDDIRTYVPEFPDYGTTVTIRHLVNMISGIKDFRYTANQQWDTGKRFGGFFDNQDALDIILQQESLEFEPGEKSTYCNANYILLAEIIERVSGQTLREFADENIFRPLGMRHTFYRKIFRLQVQLCRMRPIGYFDHH